jgi:predicted DNA-binding ribbon-helix-helix protein
MISTVQRRSVIINGHKTSVSLEDAFWSELKNIAQERGTTASLLVAEVDQTRAAANLSSALRLFVLAYYRDRPPRVR